ncbi:FMN-dependent NADH-azoreductase [Ancylobacter aquaticus]|uniref:FMN dependent NADH:quinone oxidoreductase n=1 Tax=Ancylobacter aquaticus TaxID=100 RepID=A0A4R1I5K9_ANCAQ|nr:NAD(P)H-dependent oxidoreductase [Ancylobacter aquaticus]TCK29025.1 FMN-dependent NADH-azoreductase [Ancylobacter aquaticus]
MSLALLHLDSSILGDHSVSRQVSAAIVARLTAADPSLAVLYRDLAADPLPHATPASMPADHPLSGGKGDGASQQALDDFRAADIVVIGAPMYNFSIPTQLRAWIDRILVPGKTFAYGDGGKVTGLAAGKRVIVALARGGFYADPAFAVAAEHAETYLRWVFGFIGITPEFIIADGIAAGQREAALESAMKSAGELKAA